MAGSGTDKRQRQETLSARFNDEEAQAVRLKADRAGISVASLIRASVLDLPLPDARAPKRPSADMQAVARGRHTNDVSVTSDETVPGYEAPQDNNLSYEDTTVRVRADLEVKKVPSVSTIDLRQEFSWTITVTNKAAAGIQANTTGSSVS